jgi:hypothetical protein
VIIVLLACYFSLKSGPLGHSNDGLLTYRHSRKSNNAGAYGYTLADLTENEDALRGLLLQHAPVPDATTG